MRNPIPVVPHFPESRKHRILLIFLYEDKLLAYRLLSQLNQISYDQRKYRSIVTANIVAVT